MSPRRSAPEVEEEPPHRITCRLDELLAARGMTLTELAQRVGVSVVNLSILKNDRARAIRFSTLTAICDALGCQPGDVLVLSTPPGRGALSDQAAGQA